MSSASNHQPGSATLPHSPLCLHSSSSPHPIVHAAHLHVRIPNLPSPHFAQVDPVVSAAVHNANALYAKARQDFSGYYRAALQYLCYVSVDDLPSDDCLALARARAWSSPIYVDHPEHR